MTDDMVSTLTWSIFIKKGAFNDVRKHGIYFISIIFSGPEPILL